MRTQIAVMIVGAVCLATATDSYAQTTLREAARLEGQRLAASPSLPQSPQPSAGRRRHRAVAWGAGIGGAAGLTGGLLQPTHSNGEYVLGSSRVVSAIVLGGIGAGLGAVIGFAVDNR